MERVIMSLYNDLKKFDSLGNPDNKNVYYITERKNQAIHPLIKSYNFEEAYELMMSTGKMMRLKKDDFNLVFIDVDTKTEEEYLAFLNKIKDYKYVMIKSQTPNHCHIFFRDITGYKTPFKLGKDITIWDYWVNYMGINISLGADLPSPTNGREFIKLPDEVDYFPIHLFK